jgi:hypothetical protein
MLPDSYKELSMRKRARSFLDNRLVTEPCRREFAGEADPDGEPIFCRLLVE